MKSLTAPGASSKGSKTAPALLESVISNAVMEMYEFSMDTRRKMKIEDRVLPYYDMSYLKEGEAVLKINGIEYKISPGDVLIIPAGVKHSHIKTNKGTATFLWWHFNYRLYNTIDVLRMMGFPVMFRIKNAAGFEKSFLEYLDSAKTNPGLKGIFTRRAKALEIMALLLGEASCTIEDGIFGNINPVFLEIFNRITAPGTGEITLEFLAGRYHMHPTYLSNQFRKYFGVAPIALSREVKIKKAKDLLCINTMSISEIAGKLGFESGSVFTRFFTKKTGVSPSAFRKNIFPGNIADPDAN